MHKAPIVESKQIEHVLNERRILQEASHQFCVKLCGAYQDRNSLYLLQVMHVCFRFVFCFAVFLSSCMVATRTGIPCTCCR